MKKWLMPVFAIASLSAGFFVPFGISQGFSASVQNADKEKVKLLDKALEQSSWTLDNSYLTLPADHTGKKTIVESVRDMAELDKDYKVAICDVNEDTNKEFYSINQINLDNPFESKMLFKFKLVVAHNNKILFNKIIDNEWMLKMILKENRIDYFDLFSIPQADISNGGLSIINNLNDFLLKNKSSIAETISSNKLGSENNIQNLFSSIDKNDFVISSLTRQFYLTSSAAAEMLNFIAVAPSGSSVQKENFVADRNNKYSFYLRQNISNTYFHDDLLPGGASDDKYDLNIYKEKINSDTTIDELRHLVNSFLTERVLNKTGLSSDIVNGIKDDGIFNVEFWKSNDPKNSMYSTPFEPTRQVSKMWGFADGKPWSWIGVDKKLKQNYEWLSSLVQFSNNYDERFRMEFEFTKGDNN